MEQAGEERTAASPKLGEPMKKALAARGSDVSLADAADLSNALLRLAEQGLLVTVERPASETDEGSGSDSSVAQEGSRKTQQLHYPCSNPVSPKKNFLVPRNLFGPLGDLEGEECHSLQHPGAVALLNRTSSHQFNVLPPGGTYGHRCHDRHGKPLGL